MMWKDSSVRGIFARQIGVVGADGGTHSQHCPGNIFGNPAKPQKANGQAGNPAALVSVNHGLSGPAAGMDEQIIVLQLAAQRHNQSHLMHGHFFHGIIRHIAHQNSTL